MEVLVEVSALLVCIVSHDHCVWAVCDCMCMCPAGMRSSWCRSVLLKLPDSPQGSTTSQSTQSSTTKPSHNSPVDNDDEDSRAPQEYFSHYGSAGSDEWRGQGRSKNRPSAHNPPQADPGTGVAGEGTAKDPYEPFVLPSYVDSCASTPPPPNSVPPPPPPTFTAKENQQQQQAPPVASQQTKARTSAWTEEPMSACPPPPPPPSQGTAAPPAATHTTDESSTLPRQPGRDSCINDSVSGDDDDNDDDSGAMDADENDMPEEEDFTGAEKIFKLHPPPTYPEDTCTDGKYVQSVRASVSDRSVVVGYITTNKTIFVRIRQGEWLYLQAHWGVAKGSSKRTMVGVATESQWGWVKRSMILDDGMTHLLLRQVPPPTAQKPLTNSSRPRGVDEASYASTDSGASQGSDDEDGDNDDDDFLFGRASTGVDGVGRDGSTEAIPLWYEQRDENGYTYYYNEESGESEWFAPEWVEEIDENSGARYALCYPQKAHMQ